MRATMNKKIVPVAVIIGLTLLWAGCRLAPAGNALSPTPTESNLTVPVGSNPTMQVENTPTEPAAGSAAPASSISGFVYPPEGLEFSDPRVVAYDTRTWSVYAARRVDDHAFFINLPPGDYRVVAYDAAPQTAAGWTERAAGFACADHSLAIVSVPENSDVHFVKAFDWAFNRSELPPNPPGELPALDRFPTRASQPAQVVSGSPAGVISGVLSYPSEVSPPQRVVALDLDSPAWYSLDARGGVGEFRLSVPPGRYHVIAYFLYPSVSASEAVTAAYSCGEARVRSRVADAPCLQEDVWSCRLDEVQVSAGQTVEVNMSEVLSPGLVPPPPFPHLTP